MLALGVWVLTGTLDMPAPPDTKTKEANQKAMDASKGKIGGTGPGGSGGVRNTDKAKSPDTNKGKTKDSKGKTPDTKKAGLNDRAHDARAIGSKLETLAKEKAKSLLREEEGFRSKAYHDVTRQRVGYGSDSYVDNNGVWHSEGSVTKSTTVTKEQAEQDLDIRTQKAMDRAKSQVTPEKWNKLSTDVKAGLTSVAYNYGSLPTGPKYKNTDIVKAAQSGNPQAIAEKVAMLKSNPDRRKREASIIAGKSTVAVTEQPNTIKKSPGARVAEKALPGIGAIIGEIPNNVPFKKAIEKGFGALKEYAEKGKVPTKKDAGEIAGETVGDLAGALSGPFGGIVGPIVKDRMDKAFADALTVPKQSAERFKGGMALAGGMLGGPIGLGLGIVAGAGIDAANKVAENSPRNSKAPGSSKGGEGGFMKKITARMAPNATAAVAANNANAELSAMLPKAPLNSRVETPQSALAAMANTVQLGPQTNSIDVASPASENGSKSIMDALMDPAYNPLNAEFWNEAAWSFAIVIVGISLIGFGAYSMMAGNSSTEITVKGA